jgi:hypothetical protein
METVLESSADRPAVDRPKDRQRSRITNGSALLPGVDGRSQWVRRCKDVIAAHLSDLGGEDNTSAAERSIIRRASVLTVELERLEAKFALADAASDSDLDLYQRTAGNLRRLLEAVGLQRRPRNLTPNLKDYLEGHLNEAAE